jgi:plasmid stabilization system protein ParE
MNYNLRFLPEVETDVLSIYKWYKKKSHLACENYLSLFYQSTNEIKINPLSFPKTSKNIHRKLMYRFPYSIYYKIEDDEIVVIGCFHYARKPSSVMKLLKQRIDSDAEDLK